MKIWQETKNLAGKVGDAVGTKYDDFTLKTVLRKNERFQQDMENVFSALVVRITEVEKRISNILTLMGALQRSWGVRTIWPRCTEQSRESRASSSRWNMLTTSTLGIFRKTM